MREMTKVKWDLRGNQDLVLEIYEFTSTSIPPLDFQRLDATRRISQDRMRESDQHSGIQRWKAVDLRESYAFQRAKADASSWVT